MNDNREFRDSDDGEFCDSVELRYSEPTRLGPRISGSVNVSSGLTGHQVDYTAIAAPNEFATLVRVSVLVPVTPHYLEEMIRRFLETLHPTMLEEAQQAFSEEVEEMLKDHKDHTGEVH